MSKKRNWKVYLMDIIESIKNIEEYVSGMNYEQFLKDKKTRDAVVRNIEIIGEASRKIPKEVQEKYGSIPWSAIIGTRNILAHDYFDIDYELVWKIVHEHLPSLKNKLELILKEINQSDYQ